MPLDYAWTGVLIYVDDLLLVGETTRIQQFIATLKATFTLKHVTTPSKEQDVRFLGKDYNFTMTTQSVVRWSLATGTTCYDPTSLMVTM